MHLFIFLVLETDCVSFATFMQKQQTFFVNDSDLPTALTLVLIGCTFKSHVDNELHRHVNKDATKSLPSTKSCVPVEKDHEVVVFRRSLQNVIQNVSSLS